MVSYDKQKNNGEGFIGVFDSGVGGLSVLKSLVQELPHEDFDFFGDSAHAPYGEKSSQEIYDLSYAITQDFVTRGAKAVVIACNTATSAAAEKLRSAYPELPIIGVEPAVKPAVLAHPQGRVLVMATPVTLALEKYHNLEHKWEAQSTIFSVPCPGLAARIEKGNLDAPDLHNLLLELVGSYRNKVDAVVLGCTHYPFIKAQISRVLGEVEFFDSGAGTARRTREVLGERGLLCSRETAGYVELTSSINTASERALYKELYATTL